VAPGPAHLSPFFSSLSLEDSRFKARLSLPVTMEVELERGRGDACTRYTTHRPLLMCMSYRRSCCKQRVSGARLAQHEASRPSTTSSRSHSLRPQKASVLCWRRKKLLSATGVPCWALSRMAGRVRRPSFYTRVHRWACALQAPAGLCVCWGQRTHA